MSQHLGPKRWAASGKCYPVEFSTDLKALIRSHQADNHFDCAERIAFDSESKQFSSANAWWLAELSRWMYVGKRLPAHKRLRPQRILERVNLTEVGYYNEFGIHASLVTAQGSRAKGFSHAEGSTQAKDFSRAKGFSVLVFRGTSQFRNWLTHVNLGPTRNNAHRGYENALDALWPSLSDDLKNISGPLYYTGHSMGGALAALAARRHQPTAVYTFGAPPIGNARLAQEFAANFDQCPVYRLLNYRDMVSRAPLARHHVGELHYLRHDHSLHSSPDMTLVRQDQRLGPRAVMRHLNRDKLIPLPERLCDHSPQNYVAGLERASLGLVPDFAPDLEHGLEHRLEHGNSFDTEIEHADFSLNRAQPQ